MAPIEQNFNQIRNKNPVMSVFGVFFGKVEHAPETKHENDKTICPANYQVMIGL